MFQKMLQGGSGDDGNKQKVTIIPITKSTWFPSNIDIKPYCEDYTNLTIDNFYGLITYNYYSYGGAQNAKTYEWSYDASTGILKCTQTSGGSDYCKIETDIVVVR